MLRAAIRDLRAREARLENEVDSVWLLLFDLISDTTLWNVLVAQKDGFYSQVFALSTAHLKKKFTGLFVRQPLWNSYCDNDALPHTDSPPEPPCQGPLLASRMETNIVQVTAGSVGPTEPSIRAANWSFWMVPFRFKMQRSHENHWQTFCHSLKSKSRPFRLWKADLICPWTWTLLSWNHPQNVRIQLLLNCLFVKIPRYSYLVIRVWKMIFSAGSQGLALLVLRVREYLEAIHFWSMVNLMGSQGFALLVLRVREWLVIKLTLF